MISFKNFLTKFLPCCLVLSYEPAFSMQKGQASSFSSADIERFTDRFEAVINEAFAGKKPLEIDSYELKSSKTSTLTVKASSSKKKFDSFRQFTQAYRIHEVATFFNYDIKSFKEVLKHREDLSVALFLLSVKNEIDSTSLEELSLNDLGLHTLPLFLTQFKSLRKLNLSNNNLSSVDLLSQLTGLEYLNLGRNRIKQLPQLDQLTALKHLIVSDNSLSSIPKSLKKVPMEIFLANNNNFKMFPDILSQFPNLVSFSLEGNKHAISIPEKMLQHFTMEGLSGKRIEELQESFEEAIYDESDKEDEKRKNSSITPFSRKILEGLSSATTDDLETPSTAYTIFGDDDVQAKTLEVIKAVQTEKEQKDLDVAAFEALPSSPNAEIQTDEQKIEASPTDQTPSTPESSSWLPWSWFGY